MGRRRKGSAADIGPTETIRVGTRTARDLDYIAKTLSDKGEPTGTANLAEPLLAPWVDHEFRKLPGELARFAELTPEQARALPKAPSEKGEEGAGKTGMIRATRYTVYRLRWIARVRNKLVSELATPLLDDWAFERASELRREEEKEREAAKREVARRDGARRESDKAKARR